MATTRRNQAGNAARLIAIPPNIVRTSGSGGGPTPVNRAQPPAPGPAPLVGKPEYVPEHTFIAKEWIQTGQTTDGFTTNAVTFHKNAGLHLFEDVESIEDILDLLAKPDKTGTGLLDRIRIVSHFLPLAAGMPGNNSLMVISFLKDSAPGALKRYFEGFAESSNAGLRAMLTYELRNGTSLLTVYDATEREVLTALRSAGKDAVVDAVFPPSTPRSDEKKEFVILHAAKWWLKNRTGSVPNPTLRTNLGRAYDLLVADLTTKLVGPPDSVPQPQLRALGDAISALTTIPGASGTLLDGEEYAADVAAVLRAVAGDAFRNKLLAVRPRFDHYTTLDIRGCEAGTDPAYLRAIRKFFGRSDSVSPVVTAPDFNQFFSPITPHTISGKPSVAANRINSLHNTGRPQYDGEAVRLQFPPWADGFGISMDHLAFWHATFQLGVLEFSKLDWRANIPPRKVPIDRLDGLPPRPFDDIFNELGEIFFLEPAQRPTLNQIARIKPRLGDLVTWTAQLATAVTATNFDAHFDDLAKIYKAVDSRFAGGGSPPASQRIIPAIKPAGLTFAQTEQLQQKLSEFIQNSDHSIFAPVRKFLAAADVRTQDDPARMRYFLGLGLVFQLAHDTAVNAGAQTIVYLRDTVGPKSRFRQNEAIRHWIRAAWRDKPTTIDPGLSVEKGLHSAWLAAGLTSGPSGICPHRNYDSHIVRVP